MTRRVLWSDRPTTHASGSTRGTLPDVIGQITSSKQLRAIPTFRKCYPHGLQLAQMAVVSRRGMDGISKRGSRTFPFSAVIWGLWLLSRRLNWVKSQQIQSEGTNYERTTLSPLGHFFIWLSSAVIQYPSPIATTR